MQCLTYLGSFADDEPTTFAKFREFFWPLISRLVRPAIASMDNSAEILELCFDMLQTLEQTQPEILDLKQLSNDWFSLLLDYTTSEVSEKTFYTSASPESN